MFPYCAALIRLVIPKYKYIIYIIYSLAQSTVIDIQKYVCREIDIDRLKDSKIDREIVKYIDKKIYRYLQIDT